MRELPGVIDAHDDPSEILGVPPEAGEEEIRAAYLCKVKEFPPDRAPGEFERIRDAYGILRDPRRRTEHLLFAVDPDAPLISLLRRRPSERCFVGPNSWLAVVKEL